MYYYLLALWIVYGAFVVLYIGSRDDNQLAKTSFLSGVILAIVAGPSMWFIIAMAYLSSRLERRNR